MMPHPNLSGTVVGCGCPPFLGFGTHCIPAADTAYLVKTALEAGYRHIDTAQSYRNEVQVGQGIRDSGVPREHIYLTTKLSPKSMTTTEDVEKAFVKSLENLAVAYVDCYMVHWPAAAKLAPSDPLQLEKRLSVWSTLAELQRKGKIKYLAVSNFMVHHLKGLDPKPAFNQLELHPWCLQADVVAFCRKHQIGLQAYSPLGRGDPALLGHPLLLSKMMTRNEKRRECPAGTSSFIEVATKSNVHNNRDEILPAVQEASSSIERLMEVNFAMGYDSYLVRSTKCQHIVGNWEVGQRWLQRRRNNKKSSSFGSGEESSPSSSTAAVASAIQQEEEEYTTTITSEGEASSRSKRPRGRTPPEVVTTLGAFSNNEERIQLPDPHYLTPTEPQQETKEAEDDNPDEELTFLEQLGKDIYRSRVGSNGAIITSTKERVGGVDITMSTTEDTNPFPPPCLPPDQHYCWFSETVIH